MAKAEALGLLGLVTGAVAGYFLGPTAWNGGHVDVAAVITAGYSLRGTDVESLGALARRAAMVFYGTAFVGAVVGAVVGRSFET